MNDADLLDAFVEAFGRHDEMRAADPRLRPDVHALRIGKPGPQGARWRPRRVQLSRRALDRFHERIPLLVPPLYELLVSRFRWAAVEVGPCALLPSPPGRGLSGLEAGIVRESGPGAALLREGFVPFGRGPGGSPDPVCFAAGRRRHDGDVPVVRIEHEALRRRGDARVLSEVAPSFRDLVLCSVEIGRAPVGAGSPGQGLPRRTNRSG